MRQNARWSSISRTRLRSRVLVDRLRVDVHCGFDIAFARARVLVTDASAVGVYPEVVNGAMAARARNQFLIPFPVRVMFAPPCAGVRYLNR